MKNLFKQAHQMTREITEKYEVDYHAQFGLCVSYLLENKEEESKTTSLKGTEKQIKYAEDILKQAKETLDIVNKAYEHHDLTVPESSKKTIKYETMQEAVCILNNEITKLSKMDHAGDIINKGKSLLENSEGVMGGRIVRSFNVRGSISTFLLKVTKKAEINGVTIRDITKLIWAGVK